MRQIPLKTLAYKHPAEGTDETLDYRDMLNRIAGGMQAHMGNGINFHDVRRRLRILDALEHATDERVLLEDADWLMLKDLTLAWRWGVAAKPIEEFVNDVVNAQPVR